MVVVVVAVVVAEERVEGEAKSPVEGLASRVEVNVTLPILCFFLCVQVAADSSKVVEGGRSRSNRLRFLEEGVVYVAEAVDKAADNPGLAGVAHAGAAEEAAVVESGKALSVEVTGAARRRLVFTMD